MNRPEKIIFTLLGIAASVGIASALSTRLSSFIPGRAKVQAKTQAVLQPISVELTLFPSEGRVDEKERLELEREHQRNPEKLMRELNIPLDAMEPRVGSPKGKP
jgi:hypothetical protein